MFEELTPDTYQKKETLKQREASEGSPRENVSAFLRLPTKKRKVANMLMSMKA
jgi:hypothetical protein